MALHWVPSFAATRDRGPPMRDRALSLEGRAPSRPFLGLCGLSRKAAEEDAAMTEHGPPLGAVFCGHEGPWPSNAGSALSLEGRAPSRPFLGLCGLSRQAAEEDAAMTEHGPPFGAVFCGHEGPWPSSLSARPSQRPAPRPCPARPGSAPVPGRTPWPCPAPCW